MEKIPKISIVTPSYNQGKYLEQAILSVIGQNYPNLEYFIIDGGSKDNSLDIIRKYQKNISGWISEKDHGQSDAITKGFEMSSGQLLGWLNADDYLLPGALYEIASMYAEQPNISIYSGRCIYVDDRGNPFRLLIPSKRSLVGMLLWGAGLAQMATFWTKEAYESVGGLDRTLKVSMDYDLFIRLRKYGSVKISKKPIAVFRVHSLSKTMNLRERFIQENRIILRRHHIPRALITLFQLCHLINPVQRIKCFIFWKVHKFKIKKQIFELKSLINTSSCIIKEK